MISLIGALTLTVKIYICIAVFAVLIIAEILALVMLAKWKKNFKKSVTKNEAENTQSAVEDTPQAEPDTLTQEDTAENENVDAVEPTDSQSEDEVSMQSEETQVAEEVQETAAEEQTEDEKPNDNKWSAFAFAPLMMLSVSIPVTTLRYVLYALIGVSVALAAVVLITAIASSKSLTKAPKQKKEKQPAQEPIQEEPQAVEEPAEQVVEPVVAEEEPVEEVEEQVAQDELTAEEDEETVEEVVEESVEEEPIEEEELVAEEEPVEDVAEEVAEEEVEEEAIEEEPVEEEDVVEELVAEEEPAVEETPVREETVYVVEKPIPMFVKPKLAPEKKEAKVRERTVVIDNVTYTMKDDRYLFNPAENNWYIVLTKTFTAKLIQSEDYVKDYYTELKNELLSYKKVHARMSKKRESFNYGRVCLARLTIRGKTLRLHLALDANDYAETKYLVEDTSTVKSLADTPLMYRIKNDRRLRYAKDLIAAVMAQVGAVKQEIEPVNYTAMYPYEETEPLIERDLITRKWYQGKVPDDKGFDFAKKTYKAKLIQSEDVVKEYYSQLKNRLLSYRKVHDRMSQKRESFRFGRTCVARMAIRGKTLKLYLALDPNDYVDTKYKFEDASEVKSVADTPFLMKIKNPRRLKYALELIDVVMENVGTVPKRDIDELDYAADLPFESTEDLMEKGLVVNVHVKSNSFVAKYFSVKKSVDDEAAADEDEDN